MATNITSTALDFTDIKEKLKTYLAAKSEFADYDFEGSGLSNLLDVLAYNTHFNGIVANMALNEAFLHTAQLRSSLVSHAESLGFNIRSRTSAQAKFTATLNLNGVVGRASSYTLPINSVISGFNEEGTFSFLTQEVYTATDDGAGLYTFKDADGVATVTAFEGSIQTKTFFVGEKTDRQIYVIPDENIDTTTAVVRVFPDTTSTAFVEFTPLEKAIKVDSNSTYYTLRETPNGGYELNFGDGVTFGKAPESGSKIVVTYLRSNGPLANDCKQFTTSIVYQINASNYSLNIVPTTTSVGGGEKQSIESIRQLAPSAFATQQRLVTSEDYRATIAANFPTVSDVSVWGGEDNIPVDYGKAYISLTFNDGLTESSKAIIRNQIKENFSDNLSVMSITPEFVDPAVCRIEMIVSFAFNPDLTGSTSTALEDRARQGVRDYFATISGFGKTFRRSNALTDIDELSAAVLNSSMTIKLQMRLEPVLNAAGSYSIVYPVKLAIPDDVNHIVESSLFEHSEADGICKIVNQLGTNVLQIVDVSDNNAVVVGNIGSYSSSSGEIKLDNFTPTTILSGDNFIKFSATPADQTTVKALRNFTFEIDEDKFTVGAIIDREDVRVAL